MSRFRILKVEPNRKVKFLCTFHATTGLTKTLFLETPCDSTPVHIYDNSAIAIKKAERLGKCERHGSPFNTAAILLQIQTDEVVAGQLKFKTIDIIWEPMDNLINILRNV